MGGCGQLPTSHLAFEVESTLGQMGLGWARIVLTNPDSPAHQAAGVTERGKPSYGRWPWPLRVTSTHVFDLSLLVRPWERGKDSRGMSVVRCQKEMGSVDSEGPESLVTQCIAGVYAQCSPTAIW